MAGKEEGCRYSAAAFRWVGGHEASVGGCAAQVVCGRMIMTELKANETGHAAAMMALCLSHPRIDVCLLLHVVRGPNASAAKLPPHAPHCTTLLASCSAVGLDWARYIVALGALMGIITTTLVRDRLRLR